MSRGRGGVLAAAGRHCNSALLSERPRYPGLIWFSVFFLLAVLDAARGLWFCRRWILEVMGYGFHQSVSFLLVRQHTLSERQDTRRREGGGAGPDWISMIPSFISAIGQSPAVKSVVHLGFGRWLPLPCLCAALFRFTGSNLSLTKYMPVTSSPRQPSPITSFPTSLSSPGPRTRGSVECAGFILHGAVGNIHGRLVC